MNFSITNLQVLRYTTEEPGYSIVPSTNEGADLPSIQPDVEYKVSIKIDTNLSFDAVGFNLTWEGQGEGFDLVFEEPSHIPKKEDGDLFDGSPRDLVVNPFLADSPKRLYIMKSLLTKPLIPISSGVYTIVSVFFKTKIIEDRVHVFISIASIPVPTP